MARQPGPESPVQPAFDRVEGIDPGPDRSTVAIGTWVAILGAVRLAGELTRFAGDCRESMAAGQIASRGWAWFLAEHPPALVLIAAWPLILGLSLRRTGWRELVKAAALTFLVLSIGGVLSAVADWSQASVPRIAIGSFSFPRSGWSRLSTTGSAILAAGAAQLLLELATSVWALALAFRREADHLLTPRRSNLGRMALYVSVAFLLLTIRLPAWSAYLELINQSSWVREFILRDDMARMRATRRLPFPESGWATQVHTLLGKGERAWSAGDYAASSDHYAHLVALLNTIPVSTMNLPERKLAARALNNWAWLLATCPEAGLRNHADSVKYARRALELDPNDYTIWNTMGVANYRIGAWDDALSALYRSMELHDEGDSSDWFFLAMIHQQLGNKERAREWYDKAVRFTHRYFSDNEEYYRFEVEAAGTLGLPRPEREPPTARHRMGPRPLGPNLFPRRGRMGPRFGSGRPSDSVRSMRGRAGLLPSHS